MHTTHGSKAFTIIELLIVIIAIAILTTIAIISYRGIQGRAAEARGLSQLSQVRKEMEVYYIEHGKWPFEDDVRTAMTTCGTTSNVGCAAAGMPMASYFSNKGIYNTGWCDAGAVDNLSVKLAPSDGRLLWSTGFVQGRGSCGDSGGWSLQDTYMIGEKSPSITKGYSNRNRATDYYIE